VEQMFSLSSGESDVPKTCDPASLLLGNSSVLSEFVTPDIPATVIISAAASAAADQTPEEETE